MDTVREWVGLIDSMYPQSDAASWDTVGLQVGDPDWPVARVLVALDVTRAVIEEAASEEHTLVLAHHPLFFRPLERLTPSTPAAATALLAASHRVAVLAAHTNLDVADDGAGTSDPVVNILGLADVVPLVQGLDTAAHCKLVTFVPVDDTDAVIDALATAGAGVIGAYERCSFRVAGTGSFRPGPEATPRTGETGVVNDVAEDRVEMVVPRRLAARVVTALRAAHPYEEVAYDLHSLVEPATHGIGRVGTLPAPMPLRAVAAMIRDELPSPHLRFAGEPDRLIHTVAVVGGAGDSHVGDALACGADVFVTGDLRHHVTLDALEQGLAMIDAGHHAVESAALPPWIDRIRPAASGAGLAASVVASGTPTGPWH